MVTEQNEIIKAIQIAIQMEIDGKVFYLKASQESGNNLGKKLLQSLAAEEDKHLQKFSDVYNAIRNKKAWPKADFWPHEDKGLRTIFARASEEINLSIKALTTELDAVQTAMDMENKSYDFYMNQTNNASSDIERSFYEAIAAEEQEHNIVLIDYYEYLKDPAGWFVKKERPSMDGS